MIRRSGLAALVLAGLLVACSDDGADAPSPSPAETTTESESPTTVPTDTAAPDTAAPDTAAPDTAAPDTEPTDTEPESTEPAVRPEPVVGDATLELEELVDLAVRPGDDRLFLVERTGRVTISDGTEALGTALDITDLTAAGGEQGFLGLTFGPEGDLAYVNYTDLDGHTVVAEYPVADDGTFDDNGARVLITIEQPYPNHNGGDVVIGPDGYLYIGMGDGGAADDPERRALDLDDLLGKVLRIDPTPDGDQPYSIPADNPYVSVDGARPEIFIMGVRNPWRFSFDPSTGDLWIADVGQGVWEEVNHLPAVDGAAAGSGVSLGWSAFEGEARFNDDQDGADALGRPPVTPIHVYEHGDDGCSISGGEVYRGSAIAGLDGWYVFGDYCSGKVWALELLPDGTTGEVKEIGNVSELTAIAAAPDGELWALSLGGTLHPVLPG